MRLATKRCGWRSFEWLPQPVAATAASCKYGVMRLLISVSSTLYYSPVSAVIIILNGRFFFCKMEWDAMAAADRLSTNSVLWLKPFQ